MASPGLGQVVLGPSSCVSHRRFGFLAFLDALYPSHICFPVLDSCVLPFISSCISTYYVIQYMLSDV